MAGTTSLSATISRHTHIARARSKELHFFDDESRNWVRPSYHDYVCQRRRPEHRIAGDATPTYLFWPRALERMHAYRPDMRLIAVFRDPVERLFTQWCALRTRQPWRPDWPAYLNAMWPTPLPFDLPGGFKPGQIQALSGVARGLYGLQLDRGLGIFPREQWLLLEFNALTTDHRAALDSVTDHLDVPRFEEHPALDEKAISLDTVPGTPPSAADVDWLASVYAEDLAHFERLSGIDTSGWPTRQVLDGATSSAEVARQLAAMVAL